MGVALQAADQIIAKHIDEVSRFPLPGYSKVAWSKLNNVKDAELFKCLAEATQGVLHHVSSGARSLDPHVPVILAMPAVTFLKLPQPANKTGKVQDRTAAH